MKHYDRKWYNKKDGKEYEWDCYNPDEDLTPSIIKKADKKYEEVRNKKDGKLEGAFEWYDIFCDKSFREKSTISTLWYYREVTDFINKMVNWYEIRYPETYFKTNKNYEKEKEDLERYGIEPVMDLSNFLTFDQLLARLSHEERIALTCRYYFLTRSILLYDYSNKTNNIEHEFGIDANGNYDYLKVLVMSAVIDFDNKKDGIIKDTSFEKFFNFRLSEKNKIKLIEVAKKNNINIETIKPITLGDKIFIKKLGEINIEQLYKIFNDMDEPTINYGYLEQAIERHKQVTNFRNLLLDAVAEELKIDKPYGEYRAQLFMDDVLEYFPEVDFTVETNLDKRNVKTRINNQKIINFRDIIKG